MKRIISLLTALHLLPSRTARARAALTLNGDLTDADLMEVAGCSLRQAQRARNGRPSA